MVGYKIQYRLIIIDKSHDSELADLQDPCSHYLQGWLQPECQPALSVIKINVYLANCGIAPVTFTARLCLIGVVMQNVPAAEYG